MDITIIRHFFIRPINVPASPTILGTRGRTDQPVPGSQGTDRLDSIRPGWKDARYTENESVDEIYAGDHKFCVNNKGRKGSLGATPSPLPLWPQRPHL